MPTSAGSFRTLQFGCVVLGLAMGAGTALAGDFLVNQRNASTIWEWDSATGDTSQYHSVKANDADYNPAEGAVFGWIAEHFEDHFGRFVPGSGSGLESRYNLGEGGRTQYAYPKHITFYSGKVVVMSRNDATIYRYDNNGNQLASTPTGNGTGQGMATDGTDIYVSFWNGSRSFFERYDSNFNLQETIANPSGMGNLTNIVDFAYDAATGHFFGLATDYEQGTMTETRTVLEFEMGGDVVNQYTLPFLADGIGQVGGGCGEKAKLKAKCPKNGTKVKGKLKKANPNTPVTWTLDGGQQIQGTTNDKGKAKAKWKRQAPGGHTVTVCDLEESC